MYTSRLIHVFAVAVSMVAFSQATWLDADILERAENMLAARQIVSTTPITLPGTTTTPSSTRPSTTSVVPSSSSAPPSSTVSTTTVPSSTSRSTTASLPPSTTSVPPTTSSQGPTTESQVTITTTTWATVESTDSNGVKTTVSSAVVMTTTSALPQTNEGTSMSATTRNTIIGVCVGVGGAIILAVVGLLVWRLRNKRRQQDDHDDLAAGTSQFNHGTEKTDIPGSANSRSPFQSTLESYHAPSSTNAASNF